MSSNLPPIFSEDVSSSSARASATEKIEAQGDEAAPGTLAFTTRCSNPTVVAEDADCLGQAIEDVVRSCPTSVADARAEDEETSSQKIGGKLLDMLASSGESPRSPSSLSNLHTGHWQNEVSSRPAIPRPQPMELQTRKYDLILQFHIQWLSPVLLLQSPLGWPQRAKQRRAPPRLTMPRLPVYRRMRPTTERPCHGPRFPPTVLPGCHPRSPAPVS